MESLSEVSFFAVEGQFGVGRPGMSRGKGSGLEDLVVKR